ncbi:MAG: tetratricopeptide repeat protein [Candidatus Margulisiibacteriota bacterium]
MNKGKLLLFFVICMVSFSLNAYANFDRENISIKAGPTEPGEGLSIVWVESIIYPKLVDKEEYISLSVRTAASVKGIRATTDFSRRTVDLTSNDGRSWTGVYKVPSKIAEGVHIVRYHVQGNKGSIQRTVDFFVDHTPKSEEKNIADASNVVKSNGWPLTVNATCTALTGNSTRIVKAGQIIIGVAKVSGYKVMFEDGKEGWIASENIKEPTEDYYMFGYDAYKDKNYQLAAKYYQEATEFNPKFVKAYLWLAKSYIAMDKNELAADAIANALAQDDRDISIRVVADQVATKLFSKAHQSYLARKNKDAIASYKKGLMLKPESVTAWIELGESYRHIGLESEARTAFRSALKYDTNNTRIFSLLGIENRVASRAPSHYRVADAIGNDSLKLVKAGKTKKGTKIESALNSVVALTKSLGTPVDVKGWNIRKQGQKFLVSYRCDQGGGANESFDWLVDVDTKYVSPSNDNARLLMTRW